MKTYLCKVCGHLLFNKLLTRCPKCGADKKEFNHMDDSLKMLQSKSFQVNYKKMLFEHKLNSYLV